MFKTIKVTTLSDKKSIYINIDMIGHLYEVEEKDFNREPKKYTSIGHITHNNGGFKVIESVEEVFKRIKAEE
jgi:secreted PhoX family phosphatase